MKSFYLYSFIIFFSIQNISSQVVCSEDELVRELLEDLADNGKLDCLRHSVATKNETEEEKIRHSDLWRRPGVDIHRVGRETDKPGTGDWLHGALSGGVSGAAPVFPGQAGERVRTGKGQ